VKAELAEAIRTGDMMATGELGLKLNEEFPQRYPAVVAVASTKTRDQVNAETREAIRNGDMLWSAKMSSGGLCRRRLAQSKRCG
jgi:hypothetical protein